MGQESAGVLSSCGSRAAEHRLSSCDTWLSCSAACGIFRDRDRTHVFCIGFYMEEASGGCAPRTDGTEDTSHSNTLPSCLPCTTCKSGEEEKNRCTPTKDTECQCKPGTFHEDALEFCQNSSTGCPDGKVMVKDCTPWSDIKCVDQESVALAHGEAPVPGEPAA
uniref:Uncharacterized protein n=1 Tax=Ovis aries TaxID=9940 RepID=A0AC11AY29_SHEEP